MKTVIGIFEDRSSTEKAIDRLTDLGVDRDDIGVVWRDRAVEEPEEITEVSYVDHHESASAEAGKGAAGGAVGGAVTGAGTMLLASAGVALIPGIGALLAAGTAAATAAAGAAGAVGGGLTGGVVGLLIGATDDEATKHTETVTRYEEALERDGLILSADAPEGMVDDTVETMRNAGAEDVSVLSTVDA